MAHAQQLAWSPPSCARLVGVRVQERRERAGSGLAQATGVWGRGASLEWGAALVGGHFGKRGVRERERKQDWQVFASGDKQILQTSRDKHATIASSACPEVCEREAGHNISLPGQKLKGDSERGVGRVLVWGN
jgi:hypothetical protein